MLLSSAVLHEVTDLGRADATPAVRIGHSPARRSSRDTGEIIMRHILNRHYPPGTEPGALQHHPHEDSHYFGTQNAAAPPAGTTFQETMGSIAQWNTPEDDDLWAVPPPSSDLRAEAPASGQAWEEVEPDLKSDWESRHAGSGASAWDNVKTAVRHAWERMHR
jgi:hypothetical protein